MLPDGATGFWGPARTPDDAIAADYRGVGKIEIIEVVLGATPPGNAVHWAELIAFETRFDVGHDTWDVSDDVGDWWVIVPGIGVYSQEDFPEYEDALREHLNREDGPGQAWRATNFWPVVLPDLGAEDRRLGNPLAGIF